MLIERTELNALYREAMSLGLHRQRTELLSDIDKSYVAGLELVGTLNGQMLLDLRALNVTDRAVGGDIPLRQWLVSADLLNGVKSSYFGELAGRIVAKADPSVIVSQERAQTTLETLQALAGSNGAFRQILAAASGQFKAIAEKVKLLMAYKGLHDFLHDIQVFKLRIFEGALPAGTPPCHWATLLGSEIDELEFKLGNVKVETLSMLKEGSRVRQDEERWVAELSGIYQGFKEAIGSGSAQQGRDCLFDLRQLIRKNMSFLNVRLYDAAGQLDIDGLVDRLREFAASLPDDDTRAEQLREAATQLRVLRAEIDALLAEHDSWQQIDDRLWTAEDALLFGSELALVNFSKLWPMVVEKVTRIAGEAAPEWFMRARQCAVSFGTRCPLPIRPPIDGLALNDFREFTKSARIQFYHVDTQLKLRCSRLTQIADPLEELAHMR